MVVVIDDDRGDGVRENCCGGGGHGLYSVRGYIINHLLLWVVLRGSGGGSHAVGKGPAGAVGHQCTTLRLFQGEESV